MKTRIMQNPHMWINVQSSALQVVSCAMTTVGASTDYQMGKCAFVRQTIVTTAAR